jgi:hypothetical protein
MQQDKSSRLAALLPPRPHSVKTLAADLLERASRSFTRGFDAGF